MSLATEFEAAKAEVARIEAEIAALPSTLLGKTEQELADLWHAILGFFKGNVPDASPAAAPAPEPVHEQPAP